MKYRIGTLISLFLVLSFTCSSAGAHTEGVLQLSSLWQQWNTDANVLIPLLLATAFYALGVYRLWHRAGTGRGISRSRAVAYACGILVLIAALVSPLDAAAVSSFSLHMVQHLLLILVAPPLLIVGNPDTALLWALPQKWRSGWGRVEQKMGRSLTEGKGPLVVILLATGVLWVWHLPQLYDLAVRNEAVHWAEHASFVVTSVLFWTTILRLRPGDHADNGLRILYVFGMAVQGGLLGALITFANRPLYQSYAESPLWGGLKPLADQQLAGLIMWVPPAALYIGVAVYLFVNWMDAIESGNKAREERQGRLRHRHVIKE